MLQGKDVDPRDSLDEATATLILAATVILPDRSNTPVRED